MLPSGPGSILQVPGSSPDPLIMISTTSGPQGGIPGPQGGSGLIIPPERPPVDCGVPNIPGVHPPPPVTLVPVIQGPQGTPVTRAIPPPLKVSPDSVQGVKRGGVLPPPMHLFGPGNPRPFLDPAVIGSPSPQVCNCTNVLCLNTVILFVGGCLCTCARTYMSIIVICV